MAEKRKCGVFISYSPSDEQDRRLAASVTDALRERGVQPFPGGDVRPGDDWHAAIENALREADAYVLLVSPSSLRSSWANFEIGVAASRAAASRDVRVIPVLVGGAKWKDVPILLRERAGIDANDLELDEAAARVRDAVAAALSDIAECA